MLRVVALLAGIAALQGCAALPDKVFVDEQHTSHVSQHFGPDRTNYGFDAIVIGARWERGLFEASVADGIILESKNGDCYGGLWGPREVFTATIGMQIPINH